MADQAKYLSKLQNKRVLIIGGSSGIGYAVAEAVLEYRGQVILSSSNPERVQQAAQSLKASYPSAKDKVNGYTCDLSNETKLEQNIIYLFNQVGTIDHIVFTAGDPIPPTPIAEATLELITKAATVRYTAPIFVAKHAPKYLRPSPESSITLTTGVVSEKPMANWSAIAGARAAVVALGRNLALDLRPIRVNVVSVGAVDTGTWSHLADAAKEELFSTLIEKSTTRRIARPSDVAEAYVYCMKDNNVTGSVIASNGGAMLM